VAQALASWVISNNMAGVDIDLEDDTAMNNGQFIDWVVSKSQRRMRLLFSSMERTRWAELVGSFFHRRIISFPEGIAETTTSALFDLPCPSGTLVHLGR
jgi:hypothetical protein